MSNIEVSLDHESEYQKIMRKVEAIQIGFDKTSLDISDHLMAQSEWTRIKHAYVDGFNAGIEFAKKEMQ